MKEKILWREVTPNWTEYDLIAAIPSAWMLFAFNLVVPTALLVHLLINTEYQILLLFLYTIKV